MSEIAIKELEKALKYREREIESFKRKLELLNEQRIQYENDLIPKYQEEIEMIKDAIEQLKLADLHLEDDLPF